MTPFCPSRFFFYIPVCMVVVHGIVILEVPDPTSLQNQFPASSKLIRIHKKLQNQDKKETTLSNNYIDGKTVTSDDDDQASLKTHHELQEAKEFTREEPTAQVDNNRLDINSLQVTVVNEDAKEENRKIVSPSSMDHLNQGWNMESIIPSKYNQLIPPTPEKGQPVRVQINLNITQILAVKEDEQTFKVHAHYYQEWKDPRLKFPQEFHGSSLGFDHSWREKIWTPDTYFHNAIDGKGISILVAPYNFVFFNDSRVQMAVRTVLTLSCDMNLRLFPHDSQVCNIILLSLFHKQSELEYEWKDFHLVSQDRLDFPKYSVERTESGLCHYPRTEGHFCVRASIHLKRRWDYYFIRIYGPSFLLVVTTFIGFWLPVFAYPARVAIIVTPLLSLITQQTQINAEINVNYVVSLHVWMMSCTFFVFMALIELGFAVVYIHRVEERKSSLESGESASCPSSPRNINARVQSQLNTSNSTASFKSSSNSINNLGVYDNKRRRVSYDFIVRPEIGHWLKNFLDSVYGQIDWYKAPSDRNKVDYVSRLLFPLSFMFFTAVYILIVWQNVRGDNVVFKNSVNK